MRKRRWLPVLLLLLPLSSLAGQSAAVAGSVRSDSTRQPVSDAEVLIEALGRRATTDREGRFLLTGLPPGLRLVLVRAVGYHPVSVMVRLVVGDTVRADVDLAPAVVQLQPIEVTEAPPRAPRGIGREAFEERRRLGFGRFMDSVVLRRNEHMTLASLLRRQTGIHVEPLRVGGVNADFGRGFAMSSRSRDRYGRPDCYMGIVLNGVVASRGGRIGADPTLVPEELSSLVSIADLEAVEVYRSAAEIPTQFSGSTAACGVIVLWTRGGS